MYHTANRGTMHFPHDHSTRPGICFTVSMRSFVVPSPSPAIMPAFILTHSGTAHHRNCKQVAILPGNPGGCFCRLFSLSSIVKEHCDIYYLGPCSEDYLCRGRSRLSIGKSSDSISGRIEQKNISSCKHFARMRVVLYVSEAKKQKKHQPRKEKGYVWIYSTCRNIDRKHSSRPRHWFCHCLCHRGLRKNPLTKKQQSRKEQSYGNK